jgi:hypothetical protein
VAWSGGVLAVWLLTKLADSVEQPTVAGGDSMVSLDGKTPPAGSSDDNLDEPAGTA